MITLVAFVVLVGLPVAILLLALRLVDVVERRRAEVIARQIEVTDAIHREFGAVVAPIVHRVGRGWRVTLSMDARHPGMARMVDLAAQTLAPTAAVIEVVVVTPSVDVRRRARPQNNERIASAMSA